MSDDPYAFTNSYSRVKPVKPVHSHNKTLVESHDGKTSHTLPYPFEGYTGESPVHLHNISYRRVKPATPVHSHPNPFRKLCRYTPVRFHSNSFRELSRQCP